MVIFVITFALGDNLLHFDILQLMRLEYIIYF